MFVGVFKEVMGTVMVIHHEAGEEGEEGEEDTEEE